MYEIQKHPTLELNASALTNESDNTTNSNLCQNVYSDGSVIKQPTDQEFLTAIFGVDAPFAHVTGFPDDPSNIVGSKNRARCWAGNFAYLTSLSPNENNYFTISTFYLAHEGDRAQRRKINFRQTHVIVADDVSEKIPVENAQMLPPPSYKLQSSNGSEQWGWILDHPCTDRDVVDNLLDGLVAQGLIPTGKDSGMKGTTRYVRIPNSKNTKASRIAENGGVPPDVYLTEWHPERKVAIEDLAIPFSVNLAAPRRDARVDGAADLPDHPVLDLGDLIQVKQVLSAGRFDITCPWVDEHTDGADDGCAIFTNDDGSLGFKCHHGACQSRTAQDLRQFINMHDPGFNERMSYYQAKIDFKDVAPAPIPAAPAPIPAAPAKAANETVAVSHDDTETWSSKKVLKLGSTIKALQIEIEWIVQGLIPLESVILFFARGGIGKSTLMMMLAGCVATGRHFLGFPVKQRAVIYVDFENSLAVLSERLRAVGADEVLFWSSADSPDRLDNTGVQHYFDILEQYPGALFIFDTLRSSQGGDENDSKHMSEIMAIFRKLRDKGATVIALHHTTKAANTRYKGSSAIFDMVDHVLGMYPVRQPGDEAEVDEDDEESPVYRFGTKDKTRYEPFTMFLQFNPETKLFEKAPDPAEQQLIDIQKLLIEMVSRPIDGLKQGDVIDAVKDELDLSKGRTMKLLSRGLDRYWTSHRGDKNARFYAPMSLFSSLPVPYTHGKQENRIPVYQVPPNGEGEICPQSTINTELSSLSNTSQKTGKQDIICIPPPPPIQQPTGVPL